MTSVATAKSGIQWTIEADGHRAVVVEVGGVLREYSVGDRVVLDGFGRDELAPSSAGATLAPWPNRIRDGQYTFEDRSYQLPLTEPARHNAIHGLTNWWRWSAVEQQPGSVTLAYDLPPQPGYPWALTIRNRWSVSAAGLRCDASVTNHAESNAPWGYSVHPYLQLAGTAVDDVQLTVPARCRILADGRLLPMGAVATAGTEYDFSAPRRIGDLQLDTTFGDIDAEPDGTSAVTIAAATGESVSVWADAAFRWWQVFTGDTLHGDRVRRSVAIEPMTCPPDAFRSGRDIIVLEPGQTWSAAWGIRV